MENTNASNEAENPALNKGAVSTSAAYENFNINEK